MAPKTREAILEAADELFGELGFEATSTRKIGEHSGINRALIHYHFKSKQDLFDQVLDRYYQRLQTVLMEVLGGDGALRDRTLRLVDVYSRFLEENRSFSRIVQQAATKGEHLDRIKMNLTPMYEAGVGALRDAYPAALEGPCAPEDLLFSFYGMIVTFYFYRPLFEQLSGTEGYSPRILERRREHLHWMLNLVADALETRTEDPGGEP